MKTQQSTPPKPRKRNGLFSILPLIPHAIVIAVVMVSYYFLSEYRLFPGWITYIYYGAKVVIALEILAACAQTLLAPIIALLAGAILIYCEQVYGFTVITGFNGWELIILALIGALITIVRKF